MDQLERRLLAMAAGSAAPPSRAFERVRSGLDAFAARGALEGALAERVRAGLADASRLPRLPEAAIQAAKVLESPRCDVLDLADTLDAAPEIAARVIQVANGPFFAGAEPIYTARDAIVRMGIRETRNVAIAVVIRALIVDAPGYVPERKALWTQALATAAWAQGIGAELLGDDGSGFLAGLAHVLGRATLYTWLGADGDEIPAAARVAPLAELVHAALGAWLLEQWRLPAQISAAVLVHDAPALPPEASPTARALHAAHRLAPIVATGEPAGDALASLGAASGLDCVRLACLAVQSRALFEEWRKIL
jgi:HD-like signal output (HDOD) protein